MAIPASGISDRLPEAPRRDQKSFVAVQIGLVAPENLSVAATCDFLNI